MTDRLSATEATPRLLLRRAVEADIDDYCRRIYCDAAVMRMLPGRAALTLEEARVRARTNLLAHWEQHGFGPWLVVLPESGRVIGHGGLRFWPDSPDVEVLYALERDAWGKGYATEAAGAAVRAAFEELELERLIAGADLENAASRGVLAKLGLRPWQNREFQGLTLVMFELSRSEWRLSQGRGP